MWLIDELGMTNEKNKNFYRFIQENFRRYENKEPMKPLTYQVISEDTETLLNGWASLKDDMKKIDSTEEKLNVLKTFIEVNTNSSSIDELLEQLEVDENMMVHNESDQSTVDTLKELRLTIDSMHKLHFV
ncbi:hypothetical protein JCM19037_1877 [Geomicrobium sp. JCM 19037]|uniref:hypothetical protein n=1 Tax=unclassified Geomicrobium TaxID=2628951 RepID=UPI00045F108F|nr:hypothetical protein [Geomicrobium sp. JCM 19037]GAK03542.1 hypothetical protein JCM19037_1877 [Geomicrobium sp. JCM 19037]